MDTTKPMPHPVLGTACSSPIGGLLCWRNLPEGRALVGILHMDGQINIKPGEAYVMVEHEGRIHISLVPVPGMALSDEQASWGIGGLLTTRAWKKTLYPEATLVRFQEAFAQDNAWTVYGVNNHPAHEKASHQWMGIGADGQALAIDEPVDGRGMAMAQLLNGQAIWPHPDGTLYSLPQMDPTWLGHQHRLGKLMAQAGRDPEFAGQLRQVIAQDEHLRMLHMGPVDEQYCAYLAVLEDAGGLVVQRPWTAQELAHFEELARSGVERILAQESTQAQGRRPAIG